MKVVSLCLLATVVVAACITTHAFSAEDEMGDYGMEGEEREGGQGGGGGDGSAVYSQDSPVLSLTEKNFHSKLKSLKGPVLVEFYAPWCGHCKELKPHYETAAQTIKDEGLEATFAAVDATEAESIARQYGVEGFPTIMVFKNGKKHDEYKAGREAQDFVNFVEVLTLPAVQELKSIEDVEKFKKKAKVAVIGSFSKENSVARDNMHAAAKKLRAEKGYSHMRVGEIVDKTTSARLRMHATPVLHLYSQLEEKGHEKHEFDFFGDEGFNEKIITAWMKKHSFPPLVEISPEIYQQFEARGLPIFWLFVPGHGTHNPYGETPVQDSEDVVAIQNKVRGITREVAEQYSHLISFSWLSGEDFEEHATQLGIDTTNLPAGVLTRGNDKWVVPQDKPFTKELLTKFVKEWKAGKLPVTVRSEPIPESNDDPVKVLVAKTLVSDLYESDDDVFVEFYAPWCGHCQRLAPTWEAIATELKDVKGIKIAKIDATANDVPADIQGFPTLYFKKASFKEHRLRPDMMYEGGHEKKELLDYLRQHSTASIPGAASPSEEKNILDEDGDDAMPVKNAREGGVDHNRIRKFVNQFEDMAKQMKLLLEEHQQLKDALFAAVEANQGDGEEDPYKKGHDEL